MTLVLFAACGGAIGQLPDAQPTPDPDQGMRTMPPPGPPDAGQRCPLTDYGPAPPLLLACKAAARTCTVDIPSYKGCVPARLAAAVEPLIAECQPSICTDVALAFSGGCVTDVMLPGLMTLVNSGGVAFRDCLRAQLVGTTWSCAPASGWVQFPITVCPKPF